MSDKDQRLDVARIMREIRDQARQRHEEIEQRIDRARKEITDQLPPLADPQLLGYVERLNEVFDRYYQRVIAFLTEQEPGAAKVRQLLDQLRPLLDNPDPPPGAGDRWWKPWTRAKRLLRPLRRYVLRRQWEVNLLMRDALAHLVNHSAHVEIQRIALELGVDLIHATNALIGQIVAIRRHLEEWARLSQRPVLEYVTDTLEGFCQRQEEQLRQVACRYLSELFASFSRESGQSLVRLERRMTAFAPSKAAQAVGFDNLRFADALRGDQEAIRKQQAHYVEVLRGRQNILDAGCGRGELLELLRDAGIVAYGVDLDEQMVGVCHAKGLDARCEDILDHLAGLPDSSLGGLIALQLLEHLDFPRLFQVVRLAAQKLIPEGLAIFETVNPMCLTTFSGAFYADPTHQRPIHPEGARQILEMVGFSEVSIEYCHPVAESMKLASLDTRGLTDPALRQTAETLNSNVERLNSLLFGFADYAIIARKATAA